MIKVKILILLLLITVIGLVIRNASQYISCRSLFNNYTGINFCNECGERLNILKNIEPTDVVLEIGGNVGSCSLVIANRISNSSHNLVVVEPSRYAVEKMKQNRTKNDLKFNIFQGIIGKKMMYATEYGAHGYVDLTHTPRSRSYKVNALTLEELQKKFNVEFNTLVIDCEGCYERLFDEQFLSHFRKILIEWDGKFLERRLIKHGFQKVDQWKHPFLIHGISCYVRKLLQ